MNTEENPTFFKEYKPPARDAITMPTYVTYLLLAASVSLIALFAIIRHLIKDLIHDLADCLFGEQPKETTGNPWGSKDKFRADWSPETNAELEAMVKAEEIQVLMEGSKDTPAIWVPVEERGPRKPCPGPRVTFGQIG